MNLMDKEYKIKKKINKELITYFIVAVTVILGGWYFMTYLSESSSTANDLVASINGEEVTLEELNDRYYLLGAGDSMSKLQFLNDVVIPNKILLHEAEKRKIDATKSEADEIFDLFLEKKKVDKKVLLQGLQTKGVTKKDIKEIMREQVVLSKLVKEMFPDISASDKEVKDFYQENIPLFRTNDGKTVPLSEIEDKIKNMIIKVKREKAIRSYVTEVGTKGDVIMYDPATLV